METPAADPVPAEVRYRSHETMDNLLSAQKDILRRHGLPAQRWNTMKDMRKAFGLPLGNDGIAEFLVFWDSVSQVQRDQLRRLDLDKIDEWWDSPMPSTANKEND